MKRLRIPVGIAMRKACGSAVRRTWNLLSRRVARGREGSLRVVAHWRRLELDECVREYESCFVGACQIRRRQPTLGATRAWVDAMLRLGRGVEAVQQLEQYVAREPSQAVYWELLGFAALNRDPERAAAALMEAWRRGRTAPCVLWWWVDARERMSGTAWLMEFEGVAKVLARGGDPDRQLLRAFMSDPDRERAMIAGWNEHLHSIGAREVEIKVTGNGWMFDGVRVRDEGGGGREWGEPLVSLIVTARNEQTGLTAAAGSLLEQTYGNFELLLVDDGSSDGTAQVMCEVAASDDRVRFLRLERNAGIFAAKNIALGYARGGVIGFFDADDWAHPELLERKLRALENNPQAMAVISSRIRVTPDWRFDIRRPGRVVHADPASLLCRREVFAQLGHYDWVRTSADSELLGRIRRAYGEAGLLHLDECLALASWDRGSLSGPKGLGFDGDGGSPFLLEYHRRSIAWHQSSVPGDPSALYIGAYHEPRPFEVPEEMQLKVGRELPGLAPSA